jgi:hypothetical protein
MKEGARVASITNSDGTSPLQVPASQVDATKLDYQMAVLNAQMSTEAGPKVANTFYNQRPSGPYLSNSTIHDIYGDTYWSAVANSQYHMGVSTPIPIEDQPLSRGWVLLDVALQSALNSDIKLLVNDYSHNDFGDTHGLALHAKHAGMTVKVNEMTGGFIPTDQAKSGF